MHWHRNPLKLANGATNVSGLTYGYTDGIKLTSIADGVTAANNVTLTYSLDHLAKAIADVRRGDRARGLSCGLGYPCAHKSWSRPV